MITESISASEENSRQASETECPEDCGFCKGPETD